MNRDEMFETLCTLIEQLHQLRNRAETYAIEDRLLAYAEAVLTEENNRLETAIAAD